MDALWGSIYIVLFIVINVMGIIIGLILAKNSIYKGEIKELKQKINDLNKEIENERFLYNLLQEDKSFNKE